MDPIYTPHHYRLIKEKTNNPQTFNILFLPGGPGLGSEYYHDFIHALTLPGTQWRVDFPGDGSNRLPAEITTYDYREEWIQGLIELVKSVENPILVTHSFAGMFTLTIPELENHLKGFIIIGSAPDKRWAAALPKQKKKYNIPNATPERQRYHQNPNDDTFKALTLALWRYFFCEQSKIDGLKLLKDLPYNHQPYDWSVREFHHMHEAVWIPQDVPTLILNGQYDVLIPIDYFRDHPLFQRDNIQCIEIANAGHFPWLENAKDVVSHIEHFVKGLYRCMR